jgi:hypothetical protein
LLADRVETLLLQPRLDGSRCIAFGGLRVDDAIEEALLTVVPAQAPSRRP